MPGIIWMKSCGCFQAATAGDFAFVTAHAHRRAEQRFPLEATLHAYRVAHRVLSHWLREAAIAAGPKNLEQAVSAVADFSIEYTNLISSITTAEYVAHTRILAEAEGDRRTELLNILLSGYDESDGRVAQLLKRAGYLEQRQSYCIVAAQSANACGNGKSGAGAAHRQCHIRRDGRHIDPRADRHPQQSGGGGAFGPAAAVGLDSAAVRPCQNASVRCC